MALTLNAAVAATYLRQLDQVKHDVDKRRKEEHQRCEEGQEEAQRSSEGEGAKPRRGREGRPPLVSVYVLYSGLQLTRQFSCNVSTQNLVRRPHFLVQFT